MTRKEQNKILDDKIESNINQYKADRLNAEISAFSIGDLNKYEFLTRKDLKYKLNALDKARFEFSPLGQTFSIGLGKTAQGYQEEGVMKLLKEIRDVLRGGIAPRIPGRSDDGNDEGDDRPDRPNDNNDDGDDRLDRPNDNNDKFSEYQEVISSLIDEIDNKKYTNDNDDNDDDNDNVALNSVFFNNLNNEISNIKSDGEYSARLIAYQNATIEKLKKELTDRKNLTKDIIDETSKIINENKKERLEYHNKYKNILFDYIKTLK